MKGSDTQSDFIAAFWILYTAKKIEKISIRELCELAGYNRTTFYAHFKDIYDLLDKAVNRMLEPSRNAIIKFGNFSSALKTDAVMQLFFRLFQMNDKYIEALLWQRHQYVLEDKIKTAILPLLNMAEDKIDIYWEYIIEYQLSAVMGVIRIWLQNKKNISEKSLIQLLHKISSEGGFSMLDYLRLT